MRVLCVHHKGGVGKTTAAVHVAGVLSTTGPVLLIDGDTQADSFRFFNGGLPPALPDPAARGAGPLPAVVPELGITVVPVRDPEADLPGALMLAESHVVVDAQPDAEQIGHLLVEVRPDLVLLCVKKYDVLSFSHLGSMFATLRALWDGAGLRPRVVILSAGAPTDQYEPYVPDTTIPHETPPPLPFEPDLVGRALLEGRFVWDLPGGDAFYGRYEALINPATS